MIAQLFSCVRTVTLFFLHGLSFFLFWPPVTGGSNVTFNHRRFEAKDGSLLCLPALVNEETRILTSAICHKSERDISFLSPQPHYIQVYLRTGSGCCGSGFNLWIDFHGPLGLSSCSPGRIVIVWGIVFCHLQYI